MVQEDTKNKLLVIEVMLALVLLVFIGAFALDTFFPTAAVPVNTGAPGIVGFVPVEIKSQLISLVATEPTSFVIFSEREEQFELTSLRISGEVIGTGRAEIVLDNGLGQELLLYSNIKQKQGNMITGMAVRGGGEPLPEDAEIKHIDPSQAWFKIAPNEDLEVAERPTEELGDDKQAVAGEFQHSCVDTCYMNMKMKLGLYYTLKVKLDPGTEVRINELKYMLEV
jgi:hypothetical protein